MAITEHWQSSRSIEAFQMDNYYIASSYCRTAANAHGGTVLYALNSLKSTVRDDITSLTDEYTFECTAAEFTINNIFYVICVVYRPPSSDLNTFINKLDLLLEKACKGDKFVLVAGDFNIICWNLLVFQGRSMF